MKDTFINREHQVTAETHFNNDYESSEEDFQIQDLSDQSVSRNGRENHVNSNNENQIVAESSFNNQYESSEEDFQIEEIPDKKRSVVKPGGENNQVFDSNFGNIHVVDCEDTHIGTKIITNSVTFVNVKSDDQHNFLNIKTGNKHNVLNVKNDKPTVVETFSDEVSSRSDRNFHSKRPTEKTYDYIKLHRKKSCKDFFCIFCFLFIFAIISGIILSLLITSPFNSIMNSIKETHKDINSRSKWNFRNFGEITTKEPVWTFVDPNEKNTDSGSKVLINRDGAFYNP